MILGRERSKNSCYHTENKSASVIDGVSSSSANSGRSILGNSLHILELYRLLSDSGGENSA